MSLRITNPDVQISNEVYQRTFSSNIEGSVGCFASKITVLNDCVLFSLSEYDKGRLKDFKLKPSERIFRYQSEKMNGWYKPLIKINIEKGLLYYLTEESFDGVIDDAVFETRGVKVNYMKLSEEVV